MSNTPNTENSGIPSDEQIIDLLKDLFKEMNNNLDYINVPAEDLPKIAELKTINLISIVKKHLSANIVDTEKLLDWMKEEKISVSAKNKRWIHNWKFSRDYPYGMSSEQLIWVYQQSLLNTK